MNSYLLVFAIFLLIILIVLIVFLVFFSLKFIKKNELSKSEESPSKNIVKSPFCFDHPDLLADGTCSIDGECYCEQCLTKVDDIKIARKNIDAYANYEWCELGMFKNSKSDHDFKERIYKIKYELWQNRKIPFIIRGHFKINVENDAIETFTTLMCRKQDEKLMKKELSFIKL